MVRKTLIALVALVVLSAGTNLAEAQRQSYRGTFRTVRQLILRIENRADLFSNSLNAQNQSRVYGARDANLVQDFRTSVAQLRVRFDRREATAADVQNVLNRAVLIDRFMERNARGAVVLRNWTNLRSDLNQLATAFNLTWPLVGQTYPNSDYPNTNPDAYASSRLTGTYRLDPSNSDDPGQAADRATQSYLIVIGAGFAIRLPRGSSRPIRLRSS